MSWRALSLVLLTMCGLSACASSHGVHSDAGPAADSALVDTAVRDASPVDSSTVDSARDAGLPRDAGPDARADGSFVDAGPEDCSEIAGFRRCDRCAEPCPPQSPGNPAILFCPDTLGVCVDRHHWADGGESSDHCRFGPTRLGYCSVDDVCAVTGGDGSWDSPYHGLCMPADFCVEALAHPDLPEFECLYSDGTPVLTGPPAATCAANVSEQEPYCGGGCAGVECPVVTYGRWDGDLWPEREARMSCIGLSEQRGFGVCGYATVERSGSDYSKQHALDQCRWFFHTTCAILTTSNPAPAFEDSGVVVRLDVCRDYRSRNADSVECRAADWTAIVP